ncbi:MAG: tetratricopeptide repeat protein [Flavobacteriales bacterium]|nr:tetratricopeptide repeat protein [Flavobacteriales bacterium]
MTSEGAENNGANPSIGRFIEMINQDQVYFFDEFEFVEIISHLMTNGDFIMASKAIELGKSQHPSSIEILLQNAEFYIVTSRLEEGLALLNDLEGLETINADILVMKASIQSQLGNSKEAINNLSKALDMGGHAKDELCINLAFEYQGLGNYDKALGYIKEALKLNPNNQDAIYELAYCYDHLEQLEESLVFYEEFIDNNPYSYSAWYNKGYVYTRLALHEKALESYDFATIIKEDFVSAYINKANTLQHLGRYEEAIETYQSTFDHEDPKATTYYYIGECFEDLEEYEDALKYYKKSIAKDEGFADAYAGVASVLEVLGRYKEAIPYVNQATIIDESNETYFHLLADLQKKCGEYDNALLSYNKSVSINPAYEECWLDYADTYFESYQTDSAIEVLNEALKYIENSADILYRLTAYLIDSGKITDASDVLYNALDIDNDGYSKLFEYLPLSKNSPVIMDIIQNHKSK